MKTQTFAVKGQKIVSQQSQILHTIARKVFLAKKQALVIELPNIFQEGIMSQREWNRFRNRFNLPFPD